jgi:hypothetical protein
MIVRLPTPRHLKMQERVDSKTRIIYGNRIARIVQAMQIVKNDHRGCKVALERIFDYDNAKRPENCRSDACL